MSQIRQFETGATRDTDADKLDLEGFLSPLVIERFGEYMHKKRRLPNGDMRESDNWQLGIPQTQYVKSAHRHFLDWWKAHRGYATRSGDDIEDEICALIFNAQGYLHELIRANSRKPANTVVPKLDELQRIKDEYEKAHPPQKQHLPHWDPRYGGSLHWVNPCPHAAPAGPGYGVTHPMNAEALRDEFQRDDQGTGV